MLKREDKILIANALLKWLGKHQWNLSSGPTSRTVIIPFSKESGYTTFDVWKAFALLRQEDRILGKYNNLSIRSYTPLGNLPEVIHYNKKIQELIKWGTAICEDGMHNLDGDFSSPRFSCPVCIENLKREYGVD
jgi:hypothetical protein